VGALKLYKRENNTSVKGALGLYVGFKKGCAGVYRYGFNGQEKDNEIKGAGNIVNFKFRMEDTRLGRFFEVDPFTNSYPELTPYQFANNTPIQALKLEGLEAWLINLTSEPAPPAPAPGPAPATAPVAAGNSISTISHNSSYTSTNPNSIGYVGERDAFGNQIQYPNPQMPAEQQSVNNYNAQIAIVQVQLNEIARNGVNNGWSSNQIRRAQAAVPRVTTAEINYSINATFNIGSPNINNLLAINIDINWLGTRLTNNPLLTVSLDGNLGQPIGIPALPIVAGSSLANLSIQRGNAAQSLLPLAVQGRATPVLGINTNNASNRNVRIRF
jgi:RHS repeat-associated protein